MKRTARLLRRLKSVVPTPFKPLFPPHVVAPKPLHTFGRHALALLALAATMALSTAAKASDFSEPWK
ncbi:muramidase, partial [Mesorhizobium sp. M7A.F.Ca.CA.001.15.1.1]